MPRLFVSDPQKKSIHTIESIEEKLFSLSSRSRKIFVVELCQMADSLDNLISILNKYSASEKDKKSSAKTRIISEVKTYLSEYMKTYYAFVDPETVAVKSNGACIKTLNPFFSWYSPATYNIRMGNFLDAFDKADRFYVFHSEKEAIDHFKSYFKVTDGVINDNLPPIFQVRLKRETIKENEIHVLERHAMVPVSARLMGFSQTSSAHSTPYVELHADRGKVVCPSRYLSK